MKKNTSKVKYVKLSICLQKSMEELISPSSPDKNKNK